MDFSSSLGGAISGGFGLLGSYLNYKYNTRLAEQQNQYNLNMWNLQNEYNSPSAQMRRYEEAGLNPALMYGQVTPGNASTAPQQVTPAAPNFSKDFKDLAKAFNIEGLKQAIADTKLKQANAKAAKVAADEASDEYEARITLGNNYEFDPATGTYIFNPGSRGEKIPVGASSRYHLFRYLSDNYRTNSLLVPRSALISSQMQLNAARRGAIPFANYLALKRAQILAPQIGMLNYQSKFFPASFWIGNVKNAVQTATPFITPFLP